MTLVGELLRSHRAKHRLKQIEVADKVGCSSGLISKIEQDRGPVPDYLVVPLSKAIQIDPKQWAIALIGDYSVYVKKCLNLVPESEDPLKDDAKITQNTVPSLPGTQSSVR